tara:strand:- start:316 stop:495 length:180 start_codon:yes stop_codon:yes gene_type:complete
VTIKSLDLSLTVLITINLARKRSLDLKVITPGTKIEKKINIHLDLKGIVEEVGIELFKN